MSDNENNTPSEPNNEEGQIQITRDELIKKMALDAGAGGYLLGRDTALYYGLNDPIAGPITISTATGAAVALIAAAYGAAAGSIVGAIPFPGSTISIPGLTVPSSGSYNGLGSSIVGGSSTGVMSGTYFGFGEAENLISPLVLDLDGDGVETTNIYDNPIYFDIDADNFSELTGWISPDDGLLVWDRDGNDIIDSGHELFGDQTVLKDGNVSTGGFQALSELDDNFDGEINASDATFSELKVWRDLNQNGYSDAGELQSLSGIGITSLKTTYRSTNDTDDQGNVRTQFGSYIKNGVSFELSDFQFKTDQMNTFAKEILPIPEDIAILPDLLGYGNVYSLHQAIAKDTSGELKNLVINFCNENNPIVRTQIVKQLILKWTDSENIDPNSRGANVDAQELAVLEKFMGRMWYQQWNANPGPNAGDILGQLYDNVLNMTYAQLLAQTHFKGLFDLIVFEWDESKQTGKFSLAAVENELQNRLDQDPIQGKTDIVEFFRVLQNLKIVDLFEDYDIVTGHFIAQYIEFDWLLRTASYSVITGSSGDDTLLADYRHRVLQGLEGNDILRGTDSLFLACDDVLYGDQGNDIIAGYRGNDVLIGGTGNDNLEGGAGNDTYYYGLGSGNDIINNYSSDGETATDKVVLSTGLTPNSIELVYGMDGNISALDDIILRIKDTGETLTFKGWFKGADYQVDEIHFADGSVITANEINATIEAIGTEGGDSLYGSNMHDDKMYGLAGNDSIQGNGGNDKIHGGDGADHLYGGSGNDLVYGDIGNDSMFGDSGNDILYGGSGDDVVYGDNGTSNGNDILYGEDGDDKLYGNSGDDELDGGAGNDNLEGGAGNDTYYYGLGSGNDIITNDYSDWATTTDVVRIGPDLTSDAIEMTYGMNASTSAWDDIILRIKETGETLTFKRWFRGDNYQVDEIHFADGSVITASEINAAIEAIGTDSDDSLYGSNMHDDKMYGLAGNDSIQGNDGNDEIHGGAGNDILRGGLGNDFYFFEAGSGYDTIQSYEGTSGNGVDTLQFQNLALAAIEFNANGNDLVCTITQTGETIRLTDWTLGVNYQVDTFKFNDATLTAADVNQKIA